VKENKLKLLWKYLICFGVMGIFTVSMLISLGFSFANDLVDIYRDLADAFTVPGLLMVLVGSLVWVSTTGFFDTLTFGVSILFKGLLPFKKGERFERFYDYKARKDEKRLTGYGFIVISGAIFLVIGIIFTALFSKIS
jgi:hypothetical protein